MAGLISGCSIEQTNETKVSDLTYTIVEESETPEELKTMIEEKKTADFKLTYEMEDDLYIVRGYGEQATGGYSICVRDCYLTTNAVVFDTELIGPRKGEVTNASPSCPYIVIQVKNLAQCYSKAEKKFGGNDHYDDKRSRDAGLRR